MSLTLISKSYLVESDSEFGEEEDEFEEGEKLVESSESIVKMYMKSKWDSDEEETASNEKSCSSDPHKEPECRLLINPPPEQLPTSNIPEDNLDSTPPEADSISNSSLFEISYEEITDISRRPQLVRRPRKKKKVKISPGSPRQLKRSSFKPARMQIQTLYKCPHCLLIFATAEDLIQHLPSHAMKNSTVQAAAMGQAKKFPKPTKSLKVPPMKSPKNSKLKSTREVVHILRSCEIKLSRCDNLISDWKPLTTGRKCAPNFPVNKNELSNDKTRSGTKRRSAGISARRKMLMIHMQEGDDSENEQQVDSHIPDRSVSQSRNGLERSEYSKKGSSKLRRQVPEKANNPCGGLKHPHLKIKPHKCPTCLKCFGHKRNLKIHIRTHTGEKPYKCPTCLKSFRQQAHLTYHIRSHTGETPYKCPTCFKGFGYSLILKTHLRIHTGEKPYKCPTCLKRFRQPAHLTGHIRTHTGETPYKCPTCFKGFKFSSSLKGHLRIHTGEKPYICPMCSEGFRLLGTLKYHLRTHIHEKKINAQSL